MPSSRTMVGRIKSCPHLIQLLLKSSEYWETEDGKEKIKYGERLKGLSTFSTVKFIDKTHKQMVKVSTSNRKIEADIYILEELFPYRKVRRLKPRLVKYLDIWIYCYVVQYINPHRFERVQSLIVNDKLKINISLIIHGAYMNHLRRIYEKKFCVHASEKELCKSLLFNKNTGEILIDDFSHYQKCTTQKLCKSTDAIGSALLDYLLKNVNMNKK